MSETTTYVPPRAWRIAQKVENEESLTPSEWFGYYVSSAIKYAFRDFVRRSRETPALRERCVRYAIDGGAKGAWNIERDAQKLADYIAQGKS